MLSARRSLLALTGLMTLGLLGACHRSPTSPVADRAPAPAFQQGGQEPAVAPADATGERMLAKGSVEPGYDAVTGDLIFMLTPTQAQAANHVNEGAVAPLWMVVYPPGSSVASSIDHPLNCQGVPGNCPSHDAFIAGIATNNESAVYGTDPTAVPGHDHIFAAPGSGGDFNIAWDLNVVLFTPQGLADGASDRHLTTEAAIKEAVNTGDAKIIDLHHSIVCAVVSPAVYAKATPEG